MAIVAITKAECDILLLLRDGHTLVEIAEIRKRSLGTVRVQALRLHRKFGVHTLIGMVVEALRAGLIKLD